MTDTTATSYSSSQTSTWKRYNIAQKLKKWGRIKKGSYQRGLIRESSMSSVPSSAPTITTNNITKSPNADKLKRLRRVWKGLLRRFTMSSVPSDASWSTPVQNQVSEYSKSSHTRRAKRVSFDDLVKPKGPEPVAFCNVTKYMDKSSDCEKVSSKIYTSCSNFELKNTQEISTRSIQKIIYTDSSRLF